MSDKLIINKWWVPVSGAWIITQDAAAHERYRIENGIKPGWYNIALDFAHKGGSLGKPVFASRDGFVSKAELSNVGYGKVVYIDHGDGYVSIYAHLDSYNVKRGDFVEQGEIIGNIGYTGNVRPAGPAGAHLHFEVRYRDKAVDPWPLLFGEVNTDTGGITPADPETPERPELPELPKQVEFFVIPPLLNIRQGPTTDSPIVGGLYAGEMVAILEFIFEGENIWAHIGHNQYSAIWHNGNLYGQL